MNNNEQRDELARPPFRAGLDPQTHDLFSHGCVRLLDKHKCERIRAG